MYRHIWGYKQRNDPNKSEDKNLKKKHYAVQIERYYCVVSHCNATELQEELWSSITFHNTEFSIY